MSSFHLESFVSAPGEPRLSIWTAVRGLAEAPADVIAPGTECLLLWRGQAAVARATIGVADDLVDAPGRSGMIGHYEALEAEGGATLLREACLRLAARGATRVLGPMNGNTWMRYRLALPTEPGDPEFRPPFFAGELRNPFEYPEHFAAAGFQIVSYYESRIEDLRSATDLNDRANSTGPSAPDPVGADPVGADPSVRLRTVDPARFDQELEALHRVSLLAFADNLYYSPIELSTFRALYEPFRGRLDPSFVLLAEDQSGDLLGYLFAYPDPISLENGRPTRLILKTIGVVPAARGRRVGSLLIDQARRAAKAREIPFAMYALMRADNLTRGMSERRVAQLFRRYALYEWRP
ncbi:MAG: GNAT family N-acetyltransferase [Candidatus Eisenbacteria bacterium]|nr:GNAT family N-acetyltransferase [Candidatus Eisenbacteria bacterium]